MRNADAKDKKSSAAYMYVGKIMIADNNLLLIVPLVRVALTHCFLLDCVNMIKFNLSATLT